MLLKILNRMKLQASQEESNSFVCNIFNNLRRQEIHGEEPQMRNNRGESAVDKQLEKSSNGLVVEDIGAEEAKVYF